jgi:modulator of FtsH protease HflK
MANGFKWPGGGDRNPNEPSRDIFERILTDPRTILWVLILALAVWLASGIYIVNPGEISVIRRFGKEIGKGDSGLNYHLPWPVEQVNIVNTESIRRIEVGFRSSRGSLRREQVATSESLMLTGDENIVDAQMIVQYRVQNPSKFLFRLRSPEETLHIAAQVALRSIVGQVTIDNILTVGRTKAQSDTREFLQRLMDDYESGILITEVKLQVVDPPEQVKDAFHEVVRARENREQLINKARGYKEDLIPRARGQAEQMLRDAEGYKEERILMARGDVARFLALYEEYKKATQVTRDRLYLETVGRILPDAEKLVIDSNVKTTVLPFMPFGSNDTAQRAEAIQNTMQQQRPAPQTAPVRTFRRGVPQ